MPNQSADVPSILPAGFRSIYQVAERDAPAPLMRPAGTVQTLPSRSNSVRLAPIASTVLDAFRIVNSRHRAATPSRSRSFFRNAGTCGWHGWMVLDALLPALAPWQQVFEVAGPARDVLALAPALGLGEIQDDLHPPPHSPHRLSLGQPLRLQDRQDGIGIDLPNTGLPDDWVDIGLEGRLPLVTVLLVAPGRAVDGDVFDGCLLEGDTLSGLLDLFCSPFGDRVNSLRSGASATWRRPS